MGELAGQYELLAAIAAGGAGVVYRGRHTLSGQIVAVKILRSTESQDADLRSRFLREGRALQRLSHANVVRFVDSGETVDGLPFLVTEFVEGETLRALLRQGPMPPIPALHVVAQIAAALEAAHAEGILHRDVKPENFMVTRDGIVKMLDFGLSRMQRQSSNASRETKAGTVLGSVHYLSPEQARGGIVDERSDIWGAGVILYELLTAQLPFAESSCVNTLIAIVEKPAPVLAEARFGRRVAELVARCLNKQADVRFRTAGELRCALNAAAASCEPRWKRLVRKFTW